eukprot:15658612-Heterocapsa_arctica.AAC.1
MFGKAGWVPYSERMTVLHSTTLQQGFVSSSNIVSQIHYESQVLDDTPEMYIRRTAGLINQVIHANVLGNWFQKYVKKMHSSASTVLKDGSLTGD